MGGSWGEGKFSQARRRQLRSCGITYLDESIVQSDGSKELDTVLLGSGGEGDGSLISSRLVGNEKSGDIESTSLSGRCGRSSGGGHHTVGQHMVVASVLTNPIVPERLQA
jgi:hypothetical protein